MKTLTAQKIVAIFTAFSLAFLQAVPSGVAVTQPEGLTNGTSVAAPETSATDTKSVQTAAVITLNPLMNTGGISLADTPPAVAAPTVAAPTGGSQTDSMEKLPAGWVTGAGGYPGGAYSYSNGDMVLTGTGTGWNTNVASSMRGVANGTAFETDFTVQSANGQLHLCLDNNVADGDSAYRRIGLRQFNDTASGLSYFKIQIKLGNGSWDNYAKDANGNEIKIPVTLRQKHTVRFEFQNGGISVSFDGVKKYAYAGNLGLTSARSHTYIYSGQVVLHESRQTWLTPTTSTVIPPVVAVPIVAAPVMPASVVPVPIVAAPKVTAPVVVAPKVTGTQIYALGVTLSGTKPAGAEIGYFLDNRTTYISLVASDPKTTWDSKFFSLPPGSYKLSVVARTSVGGIVFSSEPAPVTINKEVFAPQVTATATSVPGVVKLSGTRYSGTIEYSLDGGKTWNAPTAAYYGMYDWSGNISLPVGSSTILVRARTEGTVFGKKTTLFSTAVSLPFTYAGPVVAVPIVTATEPNALGLVTLFGTKAANTLIFYSLDKGASYKLLSQELPSAALSWTGDIIVPLGSSTVLVQARAIAKVGGVETTFFSQTVSLPITYTNRVVAVPVVTSAPVDSYGGLEIYGTRGANTSVQYSFNDGITWLGVDVQESSTSFSRNGLILGALNRYGLPVGYSTFLIRAQATVTVGGVKTTLSSESVRIVPEPKVLSVNWPNDAGVMTLRGSRALGTSILVSYDGINYEEIVSSSGNNTTWTANITLPPGSNGNFSIIARATVTVGEVKTTFSSTAYRAKSANSYPVPYAPTVTATATGVPGVVRLYGRVVANYSICYSLDGGKTWIELVTPRTGNSWIDWSKDIVLKAGFSGQVLVKSTSIIPVFGGEKVCSSVPVKVNL